MILKTFHHIHPRGDFLSIYRDSKRVEPATAFGGPIADPTVLSYVRHFLRGRRRSNNPFLRLGCSVCRDKQAPAALANQSQHYGFVEKILAAEKIETEYLGTLLRLTLLTPDLIEAILNGRQPGGRVTGHESQTISMAHRLSTER